jgi:hypothetical protein
LISSAAVADSDPNGEVAADRVQQPSYDKPGPANHSKSPFWATWAGVTDDALSGIEP